MKRLLSLVAVAGIALGSFALTGCQSYPAANSSEPNNAMAGGNGEFGENPAHPGSYNGDQYSMPPTTQPAAYH